MRFTSVGGSGGGCGCCGGGGITCSPCNIPSANLTLSWVNLGSGNGSTTLVFSSSLTQWATGCFDGVNAAVTCTGGAIEFQVFYYVVGVCPTGTSNYCSNLRSAPGSIPLASYTCSPFSLTFKLDIGGTDCPTLSGFGFTEFVVTYP
jgi:hypothetical protein